MVYGFLIRSAIKVALLSDAGAGLPTTFSSAGAAAIRSGVQ
ncbi:MAG: hypothetical protein ACRDWD_14520 [Acidimicrobiia bacterium]